MIFAHPARIAARRADWLSFRQVANRHADALPNALAFEIARREQFIRALGGVEFGLVPLLHDEAGRSPNVDVRNHAFDPNRNQVMRQEHT
jgi:hypothetical protein